MAAEELAAVEKLQKGYHDMKAELGKVIVGQEAVIEELLIALFCRGHALLVGVPGLAKTLLISTLSKTLGLSFNRIQFTPDLMPSDITGTEVIEEDKTTGGRQMRFVRGPIFANVILADEINRTPPKTQAALLEAMQEHQVTAGGKQHRLPQPFFVLATQNPIEQEGTYPLPEAQLDRFMFNINVGYPTRGGRVPDRPPDDAGPEGRTPARPDRRRSHRAAGNRPQGAGGRPRDPLRPAVQPADPRDRRRRARLRAATTSAGAPARGPANT